MDREYVPRPAEYFSTMVVGPKAAQGVSEFYNAVRRGEYSENVLLEDLASNDPDMYNMLGYLIDGFDMDQQEAEYFAQGFIIAHTILSYEADITGRILPDLQEKLISGYMFNLQTEDRVYEYVQDTLQELKKTNPHLIDCWKEYLQSQAGTITEGGMTYFYIGGVLLHDIMLQQANMDKLMIDYHDSVS